MGTGGRPSWLKWWMLAGSLVVLLWLVFGASSEPPPKAPSRPAKEEVETIVTRTACHPFLLQLIASRLFETRDLAATLDQVAADEMVSNFFSVDFQTLDGEERAALEEVSR